VERNRIIVSGFRILIRWGGALTQGRCWKDGFPDGDAQNEGHDGDVPGVIIQTLTSGEFPP